jgi:hypothetical protein
MYFPALEMARRTPRDRFARDAERIIRGMGLPSAAHANCLRSFRRLYDSDRAAAERIFHDRARLMKSFSL